MTSGKQRKKKVELFYSYSHKDEKDKKELEKHLGILRRQGIISDWHFRKIGAGKEWEGEIKLHLNTARIILLLVSPNFIESDYCNDVEVKRAMQRHKNKEAIVIPVILRTVAWQKLPFGKLQALPEGAKPVNEWRSRDKAFKNIVEGIRRVVEALNREPGSSGVEIKKAAHKAPKIIIFEDDKQWLVRIRDTLRDQGCKIKTFSHYNEKLLKRFAKNDYDLLITDINLDGTARSKEGIMLAKFVREHHKKLPIIVVTGYSYDDVWDVVDHIVETKIDYLFIKNKWDPTKFLKAVKGALKRRKSRSS